jgi:glutaryl-CoA dehydrogenase
VNLWVAYSDRTNYGSDPGSMITNFKDMGDHYLLNGAKMWISNAPLQISPSFGQNEEEEEFTDLS